MLPILLTVFMLSDVQLSNTDSRPDSIANIISSHIGSEMIFDAGDVSEHAWPDEYSRYAECFPNAIPVPGNHDWYAIGVWPYSHVTEAYVNGIHIVGFDYAYRNNPADIAWLNTVLSDGETPTILYTHYPLFSANARVGSVASAVRSVFLPIIEANDVDLVVAGHGHAYERHEYNGRTYLIVGTGGAALDVVGTSETLKVAISSHGWLEIDLVSNSIVGAFKDENGVARDSFSAISYSVPTIEGSWTDVKKLYR